LFTLRGPLSGGRARCSRCACGVLLRHRPARRYHRPYSASRILRSDCC